jgi:hypothetical protein
VWAVLRDHFLLCMVGSGYQMYAVVDCQYKYPAPHRPMHISLVDSSEALPECTHTWVGKVSPRNFELWISNLW